MFNLLKEKVEIWAYEKGILRYGTKEAQADKTIEEANELKQAIIDNDITEIIDGIGDVLVTLIIQATMNDLDIENCLYAAYQEIKYRQGKMIDGTFVKEK